MNSEEFVALVLGLGIGVAFMLLVMTIVISVDAGSRTCVERVTESGQCVAWVARK